MGNTIPEIIVKILVSSGYECPFLIANLDDEDVKTIQDHVTNKAAHILKGHSIYSEQASFELLPGHRKVLFALKQKAKEFCESQKKNNSDVAIEEVELLTEVEVEQLKISLIKRINDFFKRIPGCNFTFTTHNIVSSIDPYISRNSRSLRGSQKKSAYKCTIMCLSCNIFIPCTFNKHWQTSNYESHLKSHFNTDDLNRILDN